MFLPVNLVQLTVQWCLVQDRPTGGLTPMKLPFARDHAPIDKLVDVVTTIKPTAIIGLLSTFQAENLPPSLDSVNTISYNRVARYCNNCAAHVLRIGTVSFQVLHHTNTIFTVLSNHHLV